MLGTTPETATLAVMYLRVRCFACPAFLLYNVGTGNFRGRKDTRTPLLAYLANNITYVLLVSPIPLCFPTSTISNGFEHAVDPDCSASPRVREALVSLDCG